MLTYKSIKRRSDLRNYEWIVYDIEVEFMSAWKNKEIIEDFSDVSDEDDDEILEDEELDQNVELDLELEED